MSGGDMIRALIEYDQALWRQTWESVSSLTESAGCDVRTALCAGEPGRGG
jgi:hypothetical protein